MKVFLTVILLISNLSSQAQDCSKDRYWNYFLEHNNPDTMLALDLNLMESSCLPTKIYELTQLKTLRILALKLQDLSPKIGNLINLEELIISKTQIDSVPKAIGKLKNLRYLAIAGGHLKYIPPEIGNMSNLEELFLSLNDLETLPEEISKLKNLKKLHLNLNKFSETEKNRIQKLLPNCEIRF